MKMHRFLRWADLRHVAPGLKTSPTPALVTGETNSVSECRVVFYVMSTELADYLCPSLHTCMLSVTFWAFGGVVSSAGRA